MELEPVFSPKKLRSMIYYVFGDVTVQLVSHAFSEFQTLWTFMSHNATYYFPLVHVLHLRADKTFWMQLISGELWTIWFYWTSRVFEVCDALSCINISFYLSAGGLFIDQRTDCFSRKLQYPCENIPIPSESWQRPITSYLMNSCPYHDTILPLKWDRSSSIFVMGPSHSHSVSPNDVAKVNFQVFANSTQLLFWMYFNYVPDLQVWISGNWWVCGHLFSGCKNILSAQ